MLDIWYEFFPNASVLHLPKFKSDHCPVLVNMDAIVRSDNCKRPLRFFAPWVLCKDFQEFVKVNWSVSQDWNESVSVFKQKASSWNRELFGDRRIEGVNNKIASLRTTERLEKIRCDLWCELETILSQQELMWRQYSRMQWYVHGDRNSWYFHSVAKGRCRRNRIEALKLESGAWSYDSAEIRNMGSKFIENLYTEEVTEMEINGIQTEAHYASCSGSEPVKFLRGGSNTRRKIHLVLWDIVCCGKDGGGLGLRQAYLQNKAFMVKLGWSFINRPDLLWVKILREKYKCGSDVIPKVLKRTSESSMWDSGREFVQVGNKSKMVWHGI
ncbi:hypothetical protein K1719_032335 [Acacia pycnantha]|nr:hypothetical protein K1719_032335 [Acacia pycnantha]